MNSDPISILLTHDRWATRQIIEACTALGDEQFHKPFEMGPGSLHKTITHVLAATRAWTESLAELPSTPRMDQGETRRSAAELAKIHDEVADTFAREILRLPLSDLMTRQRGGVTYTFTRGAVLTHVTTHAMHHRAQCLNMLRHVGAKQPMSSVIEWARAGEPAR